MALRHLYKKFTCKTGSDIWKICSAFTHNKADVSYTVLEEVKQASSSDLPVEMKNPYEKEKPQCILCKYKIDVNYKNVRLLSQFVSKYTGKIYGRHITGLCKQQQRKVNTEILKAQRVGLMGTYVKHPNFFNDPDLYDTSKPFKFL